MQEGRRRVSLRGKKLCLQEPFIFARPMLPSNAQPGLGLQGLSGLATILVTEGESRWSIFASPTPWRAFSVSAALTETVDPHMSHSSQ